MTKRVTDAAYLCPNCYGADQVISIGSGWRQTVECQSCGHVVSNLQYGQAYGPANPKTQIVNGRIYYHPKMPIVLPPILQPKPEPAPEPVKQFLAMGNIEDDEPLPEYSRWDEL